MLKVIQILVIALALAGSAATLSACGQKGGLYLPTTPESAGRATLPQILNPSHKKPTPESNAPAAPASTPVPAPLTPTRP